MINYENLKEYQQYFHSYFGRSPDYYTKRLELYLQGKKYSFNIYAFFFNCAWLVFRKMYKPFLLLLLVFLILAIIVETLHQTGAISNSTNSDINILYYFLIPAITGCFSNKWYIKRSIKTVETAVSNSDDSTSVTEYLKKKGGTSTVALVIFIIISIVLNVAGTALQ